MFKMSAFGLNTSSQVCWRCIGQLHHQSATAPGCTTQLHDTCGLSLPVRNQVNQFHAPLSTNFLLPFLSSSYQKIHQSVAEHRSLLISISFKSKLCLSISMKYLPVIYLSLHDNDVMFTPWINKKLIMRWDGERELSLWRHCTRTKNTIDSCINSATDRFLQRRFTKFNGIT